MNTGKSKLDNVLKQAVIEKMSITFEHEFLELGAKKLLITINPSVENETGETLLILITIEEIN